MSPVAPPIARLLQRPESERRLGPFLLIKPLGRGGFAPVWLARERYGGTELRTAAVKLFALDAPGPDADGAGPRSARSAAAERRRAVIEEARLLCQVEHPSVVRFYALPVDEELGVIGLAMEHIAGVSLDHTLAARGPLSVAETLSVGIAIASALAAVHRAGLVHRDVKPANVVEAAGVHKLIDFGIAAADAPIRRAPVVLLKAERARLADLPYALARPSDAALAATLDAGAGSTALAATLDAGAGSTALAATLDAGAGSTALAASLAASLAAGAGSTSAPTEAVGPICGTLGYMDPVVLATHTPATPASDLYALGAMLFECLTGRVPAAISTAEGTALSGEILDGRAPPPPLLEVAPDAPRSLARLIDALLSPDPRDRPASAEPVAIALEQIRGELAGDERRLPPEDVGPFRGLGRFNEADRDVYFGRRSEVAAAVEMLRCRGVVALVGPSGSGKSSLARAGVLPAVGDGALGAWPPRWDRAVAEPGADPRAAVIAALSPFVPRAPELLPEEIVAALTARVQAEERGLVLLLDQLEELATVASPEGREFTVALLCRLAEHPIPGVRAVVTARRDWLDPLLALGPLGNVLVRGSVLIEPISELTWVAVLEQALAAYGYSFEDDALKEELTASLKEAAGAMPLVQFALTELWDKRDARNRKVTRAGLRAIGGIAGALERHADATLRALAAERPGAAEAARAVLLSLTTPQGTRATRAREELARSAGPAGEEALEAFERARLIVAGEGGVTLAHDALISQWERLRAWVAEAREDRLLAEELDRDAARWHAAPREAPLWRGRRLAFGEALRGRVGLPMPPRAAAFLEASRRAERRAALLGAGAVAAAVLAVAGFGLVYLREVRAREAEVRSALRKEQASRELAEEQTRNVQQAQDRIAQLLRELADSPTKEAVLALEEQIRQGRGAPLDAAPPAPMRAPRAPIAPPPPAAQADPSGAAPAAGAPARLRVETDWKESDPPARASDPPRPAPEPPRPALDVETTW
ncbi:nSTAND1 domain-containing NTPase [Sorangium sp. So ce131]|uniref:serine/threonine-protein kinase n=1 Tax=Sorangium sp. So ce131 TaxID=3133282 RepID=UPI003F6023BA